MGKEDLRVKLQVLLNEFENEHKMSEEEIHTIATTIMALAYSDKSTRQIWYKEMREVAIKISNLLKDREKMIEEALGMSEEEIKSFRRKVLNKKNKVKN